MSARGKGSNCLMARGAVADIEVFSVIQRLSFLLFLA